MVPILLLGITALVLTIFRAAQCMRTGRPLAPAPVNTVLYLGLTALLLGAIAQLTGLYRAAVVIVHATNVSPQIIAEGVLVSFNTTLFGLYVLLISALLWLALRAISQRQRNSVES